MKSIWLQNSLPKGSGANSTAPILNSTGSITSKSALGNNPALAWRRLEGLLGLFYL